MVYWGIHHHVARAQAVLRYFALRRSSLPILPSLTSHTQHRELARRPVGHSLVVADQIIHRTMTVARCDTRSYVQVSG